MSQFLHDDDVKAIAIPRVLGVLKKKKKKNELKCKEMLRVQTNFWTYRLIGRQRS